jgi:hypothetical protein
LQAGLAGRIDDALEPREDRRQQVAQPADAPRLVANELAAPADQQPDLGVDLAERLDGPQVAALTDLVGDHGGVFGRFCDRRRRSPDGPG